MGNVYEASNSHSNMIIVQGGTVNLEETFHRFAQDVDRFVELSHTQSNILLKKELLVVTPKYIPLEHKKGNLPIIIYDINSDTKPFAVINVSAMKEKVSYQSPWENENRDYTISKTEIKEQNLCAFVNCQISPQDRLTKAIINYLNILTNNNILQSIKVYKDEIPYLSFRV